MNDKGAGWCGFAALCLLSQRLSPKTPARILQYLSVVLSPPPVKDVRLLERAIDEWDSKRFRLKSEFNEEFSDNVCIAILTSMLSRDLQDLVFQQGKTRETLTYKTVRDKVMSIASHRSQMATPSPMDIGCLGESNEEREEHEVDAIIRGNCHTCGGWGHYAAECPTRVKGQGKAKGESAKGGGKSGGKVGKGPYSTNGKGLAPTKGAHAKGSKGYGYQGVCYNCGIVGHKAAECQWGQQRVQEVAADSGAQDQQPAPTQTDTAVSSVWSIDAVAHVAGGCRGPSSESDGLMEGWRVVRGRWRRTGALQRPYVTLTCNRGLLDVSSGRFGVLGKSSSVDRQPDEAAVWVCPIANEEKGRCCYRDHR